MRKSQLCDESLRVYKKKQSRWAIEPVSGTLGIGWDILFEGKSKRAVYIKRGRWFTFDGDISHALGLHFVFPFSVFHLRHSKSRTEYWIMFFCEPLSSACDMNHLLHSIASYEFTPYTYRLTLGKSHRETCSISTGEGREQDATVRLLFSKECPITSDWFGRENDSRLPTVIMC